MKTKTKLVLLTVTTLLVGVTLLLSHVREEGALTTKAMHAGLTDQELREQTTLANSGDRTAALRVLFHYSHVRDYSNKNVWELRYADLSGEREKISVLENIPSSRLCEFFGESEAAGTLNKWLADSTNQSLRKRAGELREQCNGHASVGSKSSSAPKHNN